MLPTVPVLSIVFMVLSGLIALLFPIILMVIARKHYKAGILPCLVGAVTFFLFALVLRPLFLQVLNQSAAFTGFIAPRWWAIGLYGGLAAGIFEETGRLLAFLLLRRKYNTLGGALSYGIGHGGIEAILLCLFPMINNVVYSVIINTSGIEAFLMLLKGQDAVASALTGTAPYMFLAAGLERVVAICFHIAASVLVWLAATGRGPWGLFLLAILFHVMVNFPIGLAQGGVVSNAWVIEGIMAAVVAVVCFVTAQVYWKCSQTYTPLLQYDPGQFGRR